MSKKRKAAAKSIEFRPLKTFKPITSIRQARKATSDFHHGIGSRSTYQSASALLTGLHKTSSKFVFRTITKLGIRPKAGEPKLDTLEIGAVNAQLIECPFLNVDAIDLKSRHPKIKEIDFFQVPPTPKYNLVVLAMVLNCVETPEKRGEMLVRCRKLLKPEGLFFLALPTRCFPSESIERFEKLIMENIGFELVLKEETLKVFFSCFKAVPWQGEIQNELRLNERKNSLGITVLSSKT